MSVPYVKKQEGKYFSFPCRWFQTFDHPFEMTRVVNESQVVKNFIATPPDERQMGIEILILLYEFTFATRSQLECLLKAKGIEGDEELDNFYIHTHDVTESAEDDSISDDDDGSPPIRNETCRGETVFIPVNMEDSADSVRAAIDAYNTLDRAVVYCPSDAQIAKIVDFAGNQHIEMRIQESDVALTDAEYDNPILNQVFGNNGTTRYPIKVPVITAAATFSGNIRYEYNMEQYEDELGGRGSFDTNYVDAFSELVYFDGIISDDCSCGALSAYRSGSVISTAPSIIPTEISAPVLQVFVIRDRKTMAELARCKAMGVGSLAYGDAAIVPIIDKRDPKSLLVKEAAVVSNCTLHAAEYYGVAAYWFHIKGWRGHTEIAEDNIKDLPGIPNYYGILDVVLLGMTDKTPGEQDLQATIHYKKFGNNK